MTRGGKKLQREGFFFDFGIRKVLWGQRRFDRIKVLLGIFVSSIIPEGPSNTYLG